MDRTKRVSNSTHRPLIKTRSTNLITIKMVSPTMTWLVLVIQVTMKTSCPVNDLHKFDECKYLTVVSSPPHSKNHITYNNKHHY